MDLEDGLWIVRDLPHPHPLEPWSLLFQRILLKCRSLHHCQTQCQSPAGSSRVPELASSPGSRGTCQSSLSNHIPSPAPWPAHSCCCPARTWQDWLPHYACSRPNLQSHPLSTGLPPSAFKHRSTMRVIVHTRILTAESEWKENGILILHTGTTDINLQT